MKLSSSVCCLLTLLFCTSVYSQSLQSLEGQKAKLNADLKAVESEKHDLDSTLELVELAIINKKLNSIGYPKGKQKSTIINHSAMSLQYAEDHEQAAWVMHLISPKIAEGAEGRTNDFRPDTMVKSGTAVETDYFLRYQEEGEIKYDGYGYDRGHLAPSADFRWSKKALSESFFYSNMSPQLPEFNREAWAELESLVRSYVLRTGNELYVITGPLLKADLPKISRSQNELSIAENFYKVLLDPKAKVGIGFLLPHQKCEATFSAYALPIDSIEALSGFDFYPDLDSSLEMSIESQADFYHLFPLEKGDSEPIPLRQLGKNEFNTEVVNKFIGMEKTICGTVVSTYKSSKGNVFLNLDKRFPRTVFSVNIWSSNITNFSYSPEKFLENKKVCVKGRIGSREGVANVSAEHERQIRVLSAGD
ncbi:MAG: DNA/RNA non-specific endonuclease [Vicingaceae bacterium]